MERPEETQDETWCSPITKPNFKTKNGFVDLTYEQWVDFNEIRGTPELNEKYSDYRKLLDHNRDRFITIPFRIRDLFYNNLGKDKNTQLTANQNECFLEIFQQVGYETRSYIELEKDFTRIQTSMITSGRLIPGNDVYLDDVTMMLLPDTTI
jgi:hypothetical protein